LASFNNLKASFEKPSLVSNSRTLKDRAHIFHFLGSCRPRNCLSKYSLLMHIFLLLIVKTVTLEAEYMVTLRFTWKSTSALILPVHGSVILKTEIESLNYFTKRRP
jgi:hypothetical protein